MESVKLNDFNFWNMIHDINWYVVSQEVINGNISNYEAINNCANIIVHEFKLTRTEIGEFKNFVVQNRIKLANRIKEWMGEEKYNLLNKDYIWDLCAHIVGLGETMYYFVWDNPHIIYTIKKGLIEDNFEFIFDDATYIKYDEENHTAIPLGVVVGELN